MREKRSAPYELIKMLNRIEEKNSKPYEEDEFKVNLKDGSILDIKISIKKISKPALKLVAVANKSKSLM